ncbi:hypothetical protein [Peribacillus aracenensis]|uniref:hypothetical protein n=1 Tax=Peribacillus aracenensis TaxID=2976708 RepID=UPI0021A4C9C0|nr:hypothetical protein [Peribacillus sp. BBB004]
MSLDVFLDSYTWDESEWLYILIKQLMIRLKRGLSLFKKGDQEGILHASTNKKYKYQFIYFDQLGSIGDIQKNTLEEMAKSIYEYGFTPCLKGVRKRFKE